MIPVIIEFAHSTLRLSQSSEESDRYDMPDADSHVSFEDLTALEEQERKLREAREIADRRTDDATLKSLLNPPMKVAKKPADDSDTEDSDTVDGDAGDSGDVESDMNEAEDF